jgi:hypothetical protein
MVQSIGTSFHEIQKRLYLTKHVQSFSGIRRSLWFIPAIEFALGSLHHVPVGSVANVSNVYDDTILSVEVFKSKGLCVTLTSCFPYFDPEGRNSTFFQIVDKFLPGYMMSYPRRQ